MIFSIQNTFRQDMPAVLDKIAKGESFGIWYGPSRELPASMLTRSYPYDKNEKVSLRVKVGKRRRLVIGTIEYDYEVDKYSFIEYCSVIFKPKPRTFNKK